MKKLFTLMLALVMCLSICACNGDKAGSSQTPYADALKELSEKTQSYDWQLYSWLTKNLDSFKDPASVELTGNAYYAKDEATKEIKYFLIEVRADNSFGGKTVGYVKVSATSLTETNWNPPFISPSFEGEDVWKAFVGSGVEDALNEYINNNYK